MIAKIRLIVADVDGCLTEERVTPFNLPLLMKVREFNRKAAVKPSLIPLVTLCTGRPQPYVEALLKIIDASVPAICENGGMLYDFRENRYIRVNAFNAEWEARLQRLKTQIVTEILPRVPADIQPGKETHLTLISPTHQDILITAEMVQQRLNSELQAFTMSITENCLNLVPDIFDKGTALQQLSNMVQIPLSQMAAVGDTAGDLSFLKLAAYPMCPANALPEVKAICGYVAEESYTAGLIEIIEKCVAINKKSKIVDGKMVTGGSYPS